jgi:hypothetical protein
LWRYARVLDDDYTDCDSIESVNSFKLLLTC